MEPAILIEQKTWGLNPRASLEVRLARPGHLAGKGGICQAVHGLLFERLVKESKGPQIDG